MADRTITRKALDRSAGIGDLYDATTDSFCGRSIFGKLADLEIKTSEYATMSTQAIYNDESVFNNLMKFNVEPELAVGACHHIRAYAYVKVILLVYEYSNFFGLLSIGLCYLTLYD